MDELDCILNIPSRLKSPRDRGEDPSDNPQGSFRKMKNFSLREIFYLKIKFKKSILHFTPSTSYNSLYHFSFFKKKQNDKVRNIR